MPKIVDHHKERERIVDSARQIIAESGTRGLTMRKLAERCGFANGALRPYFPDKHSVLIAVVRDSFARMRQEIFSLGYLEQAGVEALRTLYAGLLPLDAGRAENVQVALALRETGRDIDEIRHLYEEGREVLRIDTRRHLEEAVAGQDIPAGQDLDLITDILMSFSLGRISSYVLERRRARPYLDADALRAVDAIVHCS